MRNFKIAVSAVLMSLMAFVPFLFGNTADARRVPADIVLPTISISPIPQAKVTLPNAIVTIPGVSPVLPPATVTLSPPTVTIPAVTIPPVSAPTQRPTKTVTVNPHGITGPVGVGGNNSGSGPFKTPGTTQTGQTPTNRGTVAPSTAPRHRHETPTKTDTIVKRVVIGTLLSLVFAVMGIGALFIGYYFGYRDAYRKDNKFLKGLLARATYRSKHS